MCAYTRERLMPVPLLKAGGRRWFAIDAARDQVMPLAKREAWNALGCTASSDVLEEVSYLSVKGPQDDLHLLFDRITRNLQE